jgi:hypothetical protein
VDVAPLLMFNRPVRERATEQVLLQPLRSGSVKWRTSILGEFRRRYAHAKHLVPDLRPWNTLRLVGPNQSCRKGFISTSSWINGFHGN